MRFSYISVGFSAVSTVLCAIDLYHSYKEHALIVDVEKRLRISMKDIANNVDIDIPQRIIDAAIEEAVKARVDAMVASTVKSVSDAYKAEVRRKTGVEVDKVITNMKPMVEDELRRQIEQIDISDVKDRVIRDATKIASDKFSSELSTAAATFKGQINAMKDIYSSLADSLKK